VMACAVSELVYGGMVLGRDEAALGEATGDGGLGVFRLSGHRCLIGEVAVQGGYQRLLESSR
jgi:hypothetical protein